MTEELEWQTRRERINKRLTALNPAWTIIRYKENLDTSTLTCHAVEEYPTAKGPTDYAFFVKGKRSLAAAIAVVAFSNLNFDVKIL